MTCRRARKVVRRHGDEVQGQEPFHKGGQFDLGSFHCRVYRSVEEDHRARCHNGAKVFRVDYGS
jgi:hypothetical protein